MSHSHHHGHHHDEHGHRAQEYRTHEHWVLAAAPTFSLLRLSAWQRLGGAAVLLGVLWLLVFRVTG